MEAFQSGLSWLTILKKRENFRRAFHDFDVERIARYRDRDIARLMADAGIVRNHLKIAATIANAKATAILQRRRGLAAFIWDFIDGAPAQNRIESYADAPAQTDVSKRISKALKKEGFAFVGPTTAYAFMQSAGMVNDHFVGCHRYEACRKLQLAVKRPT